jgi:hypothetical protein
MNKIANFLASLWLIYSHLVYNLQNLNYNLGSIYEWDDNEDELMFYEKNDSKECLSNNKIATTQRAYPVN